MSTMYAYAIGIWPLTKKRKEVKYSSECLWG